MLNFICSRPCVASRAALIALSFFAAGCSSFDREWSSLADRPAPVAPAGDDITGRWEGKWFSEPSGHEGKLRCIISAAPDAETAAAGASSGPASSTSGAAGAGETRPYLFRFSATWGPGIISEYDIAMTTRKEGERTFFEGKMSLGLFGEYQCKGHVQGDAFSATYGAEKDNGTFTMTRVR